MTSALRPPIAPQRGDQNQHVGAADFGFERTLHRVDLTFDPADASDELAFIFDRVSQARI